MRADLFCRHDACPFWKKTKSSFGWLFSRPGCDGYLLCERTHTRAPVFLRAYVRAYVRCKSAYFPNLLGIKNNRFWGVLILSPYSSYSNSYSNEIFLSSLGTPPPLCSLPTTTTFGSCPADEVIPVAPISEERATRTLSRIKLLNRIRNNILTSEHLEERLGLCQKSSDLPEWWVPGKHDLELLQAVAK